MDHATTHHPPYTHDNDQQSTQAILEELAQLAQQQEADPQSNINIPINALAAEKHDGETATPPPATSSPRRRPRFFFIIALLLVIAAGLYYGTPYMKDASLLTPTITTRVQDLWHTTYDALTEFFAKQEMFTGDTQPAASTSKTTSSAVPVANQHNNTLQASTRLIIPLNIGSSIPSDSSLVELNTFADTLQASPDATLQITYFSNQDVHETLPAELLELHANAIKGYLMGRGIDGSRIAMKNGSKSQPPPDHRRRRQYNHPLGSIAHQQINKNPVSTDTPRGFCDFCEAGDWKKEFGLILQSIHPIAGDSILTANRAIQQIDSFQGGDGAADNFFIKSGRLGDILCPGRLVTLLKGFQYFLLLLGQYLLCRCLRSCHLQLSSSLFCFFLQTSHNPENSSR